MHIVRRSSLVPMPWKNGGGVTHEVARFPLTEGPFSWRMSVAHIDGSGPFSNFSGYRRFMVLLRGAGVRLTFDDREPDGPLEPAELREIGDLVSFDGGRSTDCQLLDGPCTDLNLMVSHGACAVRAWVASLSAPWSSPQPHGATTLVVVIRGRVSVASGPTAGVLGEWDVAWVAAGERESVCVAPAADADPPLVFHALLDDNSA